MGPPHSKVPDATQAATEESQKSLAAGKDFEIAARGLASNNNFAESGLRFLRTPCVLMRGYTIIPISAPPPNSPLWCDLRPA